MRTLVRGVSVTLLLGARPGTSLSRTSPPTPIEQIRINDNRTRGGLIEHGVLTIHLRAHAGEWHPDRDRDTGIVLNAFGEDGKPLQIPGPLFRVPQGTEI